jgi:hypothetical protein
MASSRLALTSLLGALAGCAAVPALPPPTPELPLAAWEHGVEPLTPPAAEPAGVTPVTSAPALAKTAERKPGVDAPRAPGGFAPVASTSLSPIPGGSACLRSLEARGVRFRPSAPVLGIATPVVLDGTLDGIRFYAPDRRPFVADCRLVLALTEITPEWRALGIDAVRFSGTYVYKLTAPGRMSMHAYGLAIDVHAFVAGATTYEVKREFSRGTRCNERAPLLNRALCSIRASGSFKEHLGPDDNAAHFDHFHLGLKPLPGEIAADLPLPAAPKARKRGKVSGKGRSSPARSAR